MTGPHIGHDGEGIRQQESNQQEGQSAVECHDVLTRQPQLADGEEWAILDSNQ
jgi:hypothetical protein